MEEQVLKDFKKTFEEAKRRNKNVKFETISFPEASNTEEAKKCWEKLTVENAPSLTGKARRVKQKAQYDRYKAIKDKIEKGEPTTFQERNICQIVEKKRRKEWKNLKYTNSKPK